MRSPPSSPRRLGQEGGAKGRRARGAETGRRGAEISHIGQDRPPRHGKVKPVSEPRHRSRAMNGPPVAIQKRAPSSPAARKASASPSPRPWPTRAAGHWRLWGRSQEKARQGRRKPQEVRRRCDLHQRRRRQGGRLQARRRNRDLAFRHRQCAGQCRRHVGAWSLVETSEDVFDQIFNTNVRAPSSSCKGLWRICWGARRRVRSSTCCRCRRMPASRSSHPIRRARVR